MSFWSCLFQTGCALSALPTAELGYEFPPLHHDVKMCSIICSLDDVGAFIGFEKLKAPEKAIIPVTLYSMKRAGLDSADFPNPLSEKAEYMGSDNYIVLLSAWHAHAAAKHSPTAEILAAVLSFVESGSFQERAKDAGINGGALVCFRVGATETWKDDALFRSWIDFYGQEIKRDPNVRKGLCMITGREDVLVLKAPKAILPLHPNGKLISNNDMKGFTFRGLLTDQNEAVSIGVEGSHNAHQALKYIFSHGAVEIGNNDWLCVWCPSKPVNFYANEIVYGQKTEPTRDDWKKSFFGSKLIELSGNETIATAIIGGATDGRLSVKYFEESTCSKFVDRMNAWHKALSWELWNNETKENVPYYPSAYAIIAAAFGRPCDSGWLEPDESMKSLWLNRLLMAETKGLPIPRPIVDALVKRANNAIVYNGIPVPIALAALRKQYYDKTGVLLELRDQAEFQNDRCYLYGRLLAIYEKAEQDYLDLQRENRETQAKRFQYSYVNNPQLYEEMFARSLKTIWANKLSKRRVKKYAAEIASIKKKMKGRDMSPLDYKYLFGYYSERCRQYEKQKTTNSQSEEAN